MRLGGPVFDKYEDPAAWVEALKRAGYSAAYCPVDMSADERTMVAYAEAAAKADIVIAEVGAWSNPMSPDQALREKALQHCKQQLALADMMGAHCCVNIAGSCGEPWDGPHPDNLTEAAFDKIVETTRAIIDAVKPKRTYYTLETMPWMYPDSPECYLRLIKAIDRERFAVHLDPVNLVCSPQRYYASAALIRECFRLLGPYMKSCHGKDILLQKALTTHLDEVRPGLGGLAYDVYLKEIEALNPDLPLMLEHLPNPEEYVEAARFVRATAATNGIAIKKWGQ